MNQQPGMIMEIILNPKDEISNATIESFASEGARRAANDEVEVSTQER